ncbi:hypothetical protein GCM10011391_06700 [Pullulanibacillus camelliae]|uniref:Aminopeptidase n=1 Tax=Pullulanibacillus camelliae TaxID=1707096 RepID=A0A8J2VNG8_9BACL|nr:hypothetical protein GCM10011391_06700 [Pullulanibacillus camelliae]
MTKNITMQNIEQYSQQLREENEKHPLMNAVIKNGIDAVAEQPEAVVAMNHVFSEEIKTGRVSNQKQSGRCWMFAALNTFHHKINPLFKLKDFELSQNYTNFWDKFEKANFFLESVITTAEEPLNGRLVSWILATPQQDGGQWDMLVSLINKYGVVPKQVMPETFQSETSARLNSLLNTKLREAAVKLRALCQKRASEKDLQQAKEAILSDVYKILSYSLGEPPKTFDFEYRDTDGVS